MTETFSSRKYLLSPQSYEDEVAAVAERLGWPFIGRLSEDEATLTSRQLFWGKSHDLVLHYMEDVLSKSPCSFITGVNELGVATAARILEARLQPATLEEVLDAAEAVRDIPHDYVLAVLRLGLGAPESFDERFFSGIEKAARSSHEEVRKAAAWATSYVIWPQFNPLLSHLAEYDSSEAVRRVATSILNASRAELG
ncbi:hypothetical protein ACFT2C_24940 [Promicromonospora sp. NPDC057138]|uniref:hypothetical protein n=1 Tax=Promicromonospora sp. NPDC057138 TaxID=3346031 RepID=UPI0036439F81